MNFCTADGGPQVDRTKIKLIAIAATMLTSGCAKARSAVASTRTGAPSVTVINPLRRDAVRSMTLPGDVVGYYECALHSKVTGYLDRILVDKGDNVKRGQLLAVIEVPELQQNLDRAKAELEMCKLTYQRLKKVRETDRRLVAQEQVDIAYSKMMEAQGTAGALQAMESYTNIIAPFNGVITGRFADPGALVRAGGGDFGVSGVGASISAAATEGAGGHLGGGGPLLTLARIDRLRVYVYVPEREIGFIREGTPAVLTSRALPGRKLRASVSRFASSLDLATRTMLTEIDLDNADRHLYPRMYVDVTLALETHPNAIELPVQSVEGAEAGTGFVYVVRRGRLVKVPVFLGITDGHYVEITKGLSGSEMVVRSISPGLAQGEEVDPVKLSRQTANNFDWILLVNPPQKNPK